MRIGIQGTEASETREFGETNIKLALVHEFGSRDGRVPQRSFLRSSADRETRKFQRLLARAGRRAAVNGNLKRELGVVGEVGVAEVKRTINNSIGLKPNAAITIERKGSSKPLLDTAQLRDAVTWKVENL